MHRIPDIINGDKKIGEGNSSRCLKRSRGAYRERGCRLLWSDLATCHLEKARKYITTPCSPCPLEHNELDDSHIPRTA